MMQTDTTFEMKFEEKFDRKKALDAIKSAILEIKDRSCYTDLWLQDLGDCKTRRGL